MKLILGLTSLDKVAFLLLLGFVAARPLTSKALDNACLLMVSK